MQPTLSTDTTTPRRIATGQTPSAQPAFATTRPEHSPKKDLFFGSGKDQQDTTEKSLTQQVKDFFSWLFTPVTSLYSMVKSWFSSPPQFDPKKEKRFGEILSQEQSKMKGEDLLELLTILNEGSIDPNKPLIEISSKLKGKMSDTATILMDLIAHNFITTLKKLLPLCSKETLKQTDPQGNSLLVLALIKENPDVLNTLLPYCKEHINQKNNSRDTPLSLVLKILNCEIQGETEQETEAKVVSIVKKLVAAGADLTLTYPRVGPASVIAGQENKEMTALELAQELAPDNTELHTLLTPKKA